IHRQADIVEALIGRLELDRFHVLAHDYGDTVAQELLARQNDGSGKGRWLSACFLNGGLFPETHRALLTQKLLLSPLGPLLNRLSGQASFNRAFSKVFGAQTRPNALQLQEYWFLVNYKQGKHIFHNLITYIDDRRTHRQRWLRALIDAQIPLALINGSDDPVSGAHMVARYKELGCRLDYLAELAGIGHYPQLEAASLVSEHYLAFLE
ncbi:MAG: alpha/beta hydrolase, partial [Gammaproteobacteria bacterium]|nr:alpha/beta hydrolase [Gammaproteobacteria bacterium]